MSYAARAGRYANSAVVTPVSMADFGNGLWAGVKFQHHLEHACFRSGFLAPCQSAHSFLGGAQQDEVLRATYLPGTYPANISGLFPLELISRLRSALIKFDSVLPGFTQNAVIIAPETRTSSPIRILRNKELLHCTGIENLYPVGEGSGYAGGIISSAADGWRLGERIRPA